MIISLKSYFINKGMLHIVHTDRSFCSADGLHSKELQTSVYESDVFNNMQHGGQAKAFSLVL